MFSSCNVHYSKAFEARAHRHGVFPSEGAIDVPITLPFVGRRSVWTLIVQCSVLTAQQALLEPTTSTLSSSRLLRRRRDINPPIALSSQQVSLVDSPAVLITFPWTAYEGFAPGTPPAHRFVSRFFSCLYLSIIIPCSIFFAVKLLNKYALCYSQSNIKSKTKLSVMSVIKTRLTINDVRKSYLIHVILLKPLEATKVVSWISE